MNENEAVKKKAEKKFSLNIGHKNEKSLQLPLKSRELSNDFTFGRQRLVDNNNISRSEMGSMNGSKGVSTRVYNEVDEVTDVGECGSFEGSVKMSDVDDK